MSRPAFLLYLCTLLGLTGCKIEIVVPEGGGVTTRSANYQCAPGETCTIDVVDTRFVESFVAQPEAGYSFIQWKKRDSGLCGGQPGACTVNASLADLHALFMSILESGNTYYLEPEFGLSNNWIGKANLPVPGSAMATCAINDRVYAIGVAPGSTEADRNPYPEGRVEEYDPFTDTWSKKADMPTARRWGSASAADGKCYVFGGLNKSDVEEYNPVTDTWRKRSPMPEPRSTFASVTVNGKIYLVGGGAIPSWRQAGTARVDIYDPAGDRWSSGADMPMPRGGVAAAAIAGYIYVIGGNSMDMAYSNLVHRYDPATDSWAKMADLPVQTDFATATAHDGMLYVMGGFNQDNNAWVSTSDPATAAVYRYDPAKNQWTRRANMTLRRMAASSETVNRRILAIGGRENRDCCGALREVEEYTP